MNDGQFLAVIGFCLIVYILFVRSTYEKDSESDDPEDCW